MQGKRLDEHASQIHDFLLGIKTNQQMYALQTHKEKKHTALRPVLYIPYITTIKQLKQKWSKSQG